MGEIIKKRIERGIDNFFIALATAFDKASGGKENGVLPLSDVKEISVFLAGNSSKSALVRDIFNSYIGNNSQKINPRKVEIEKLNAKNEEALNDKSAETGEAGKIREEISELQAEFEPRNFYTDKKARTLLGFASDQKMCKFTIYPPLGTEEAHEIQKKLEIPMDFDDVTNPTGKTGVAFGLLLSRKVKVKNVSNADGKALFQYFVGISRKGKFKVIIEKNGTLKEWREFVDAGESTFDLLYTGEASAATNNAPESIATRLTLSIPETDPDANVYVRAVNSQKIEYAVAKDIKDLDKAEKFEILLN